MEGKKDISQGREKKNTFLHKGKKTDNTNGKGKQIN